MLRAQVPLACFESLPRPELKHSWHFASCDCSAVHQKLSVFCKGSFRGRAWVFIFKNGCGILVSWEINTHRYSKEMLQKKKVNSWRSCTYLLECNQLETFLLNENSLFFLFFFFLHRISCGCSLQSALSFRNNY